MAKKKCGCENQPKSRLLDLVTNVLELVRDGKRDAREVADVLQMIKNRKDFFELFSDKMVSNGVRSIRGSQMLKLMKCGYAVSSGIPFPDPNKLKLGPALLVDYETPIDEQCQLLGIKNWLDLQHHEDLHPKPKTRWGWIYEVEDGKKMLNFSSDDAIKKFKQNNRRALITAEGLALYRENPNILKDHYIDLSGSRFESSRVPYVCLYDAGPGLGWDYANVRDSDWGSPSCGSGVGLLP